MPQLHVLIQKHLKAGKHSALQISKDLGVSYQSFQSVAKGVSKPNSRTVEKYSKLLGVPAAEILGMIGKQVKTKTANDGAIAKAPAKTAQATKAKGKSKGK